MPCYFPIAFENLIICRLDIKQNLYCAIEELEENTRRSVQALVIESR
jgi:hypothetical protein